MPYAPVGTREGSAGTLTQAPPPHTRWFILVAFALNSGANAFLFMDFATTPDATKQLFGFCSSSDGDSDDGQYAFPICGAATWLVTFLMFTGYRQEFNNSQGLDRGGGDGRVHGQEYKLIATADAAGSVQVSSTGAFPDNP